MKREWVTYVRRIADLDQGKRVLFIKDLTPGPRKYDTKLVRAELSRNAVKLPDRDTLWIRSETGYLHPEPWSIKILEERSEERRVGKECTSWCRSRWSPYH